MIIISGKYKGKRLSSPKGQNTRPTSSRLRETVFNILQQQIEGAEFLDLFAGSGAMGFEALSRGANSASFVDSDHNSITSINQNIKLLGTQQQSQVYSEDVLKVLQRMARSNQQFSIIYVDPPYEKSVTYEGVNSILSHLVLKMLDQGNLLHPGGTLFIEEGVEIKDVNIKLENIKLKRVKKNGRSYLHEYEIK